MPQQPPQGYRFPKPTDNIAKLLGTDELHELCTCGHTRHQHRGDNAQDSCTRCDCPHFRWKSFIIPTTSEPST